MPCVAGKRGAGSLSNRGTGGREPAVRWPPGRALLRLKPSRMCANRGDSVRYAVPHNAASTPCGRVCLAGARGQRPRSTAESSGGPGGTPEDSLSIIEPNRRMDEPTVRTAEPSVRTDEPELCINEPSTSIDEPSTGIDEPSTGIDEPSTGVDEPSTGVDEPSTGVDEPSTGIDEPSTGIDEPSTGVDEPSTGVDELSTGVDEPDIPISRQIRRARTRSLSRFRRNGAGSSA